MYFQQIENYNSIKEQLNDDGVKKQTTNMKISLISYVSTHFFNLFYIYIIVCYNV